MINRRTIFALLGLAALPVAVEAKAPVLPAPPKPLRGMILPRFVYTVGYSGFDPGHSHAVAQVLTEYDIFDGEKWVPFNSTEGQTLVQELRCG